MSNLIIPGHQPKPQPGLQISVNLDGPAVVIQVLSTAILSSQEAAQLAMVLGNAATQASLVEQAVMPSPNGASIRGHIVP